MKKTAYYYLSLAAIVAGGLTSCQEEDFGYESKEIEYQTAFKKSFGTPDANHTWGFHDIVSPSNNSTSELTRGASVNGNQWGDFGFDVPLPLSQRQKDFVTNWFANNRNPTSVAISWTDYFAQQVSSTENGRHMDELYDAGHGYSDHVNNYNSGDCSIYGNVQSPNVKGNYGDRIQYMSDQSTKDFSYHESVSEKTWKDHYVIIPGELIDPTNSLASNTERLRDANGHPLNAPDNTPLFDGSIWGMYFLAFDYEAFKFEGSTDNVARDYYFNDWIIKITPATLTDTYSQRIMAEDLGLIGDFDFNDVVFDVYIKYNEYWHGNDYGLIVLQAAGGTMNLTVDGHEVHEEFGVSTNTVVNVGENPNDPYVTKSPVQWYFIPTSANAIDIPIIVTPENGSPYAIGTERGKAPGKFAVPTTVQWSPEIVNIKTTYPKFPEWVQDESKHFWE